MECIFVPPLHGAKSVVISSSASVSPSKRIQWPCGKEVVFRFLHMRSAELALGLNELCQMTLHTFVLTVVASFVTNSSIKGL